MIPCIEVVLIYLSILDAMCDSSISLANILCSLLARSLFDGDGDA
jgi:hypothetical protein